MRVAGFFPSVAFLVTAVSMTTVSSLAQRALTQDSTMGSAGAQTNPDRRSNPPGGVEILSDTEGVDFSAYLKKWHRITEETWNKLIPDEVNRPFLRKGDVLIRFKILPSGRLMPRSMVLEGRSGFTSLDKAAWQALTDSNYPPLPESFHGPYIELRAAFMYNHNPKPK